MHKSLGEWTHARAHNIGLYSVVVVGTLIHTSGGRPFVVVRCACKCVAVCAWRLRVAFSGRRDRQECVVQVQKQSATNDWSAN